MKCPNCGFDDAPLGQGMPVMRFCGMCGARLVRVCPNCGFANPLTYHFCGMCGVHLGITPDVEASSAEYSSVVTGAPPRSDLDKSQKRASLVPNGVSNGLEEPVGAGETVGLGESASALPPLSALHLPAVDIQPPAEISSSATPARQTSVNQKASSPADTQPPADSALASPSLSASTIALEGERRVATIVFADVKGSTDLLEVIGTEGWVEIMNRVLYLLESEVYRFGGEVDQFRGDGLVAFFGARVVHEDDPERALLAALAMQQAFKTYAAELAERDRIDLQLRVGVNTGEVIAANIGNTLQHSEDTAMGGAISLAARMETAAEPGTVLVSENTYRLVASQFEWEALGEIMVKGISQPITVYRPLAPRPDTERKQTYDFSVPLIGREEEFHTLKQCVKDLIKGRGGIVMVTGDKGIGKSFLMTEVRYHFIRLQDLSRDVLVEESVEQDTVAETAPRNAQIEGDDVSHFETSVTWLRGRSRSYGQSWPYTMWVSLLENWLDTHHNEPRNITRDRLRQQCEALWGTGMAEYYPYLAAFLSLPLEKEFAKRIKHLDAESLRQRFFATLYSWVEVLTQRGPLVISFADMHWADCTSLDLLRYILPLCDRVPVLWVFVFRLEARRLEVNSPGGHNGTRQAKMAPSPVWEFRHYVETEYPHRLTAVAIPPFTETQSSKFIDRLIGSNVLPEETRQFVIRKAEGNPYYIKEIIHSLINQGILVWDEENGRWHATGSVTSLDLPDSLQNLLMARIDHLLPEERQILQMAAVIGAVFWMNVLQSLVNCLGVEGPLSESSRAQATMTEETLKSHLTTLQRMQLILERGRVPELGMEYVFKSTLIRDAAYEGLLSAQRSVYHLKVAEYLESHFSMDALAPYYALLAYHYRQGNEVGKELFYTLQAAEQAKKIYASAEALDHYTHALTLLDTLESQLTDDQAEDIVGDEDASTDIQEDLKSPHRRYIIQTQRFEVLDGRREVYIWRGEFDAARDDARALLPLAEELDDDPVWMIDALLRQPGVESMLSREEVEAARPLAEKALHLAQSLGDRHREMRCFLAIASQLSELNDPAWPEVADRALALARELGDQRYEVKILIGFGQIYAASEPERSMKYLEAALPISQALDDKMTELNLLKLIGVQLENSDDYYRRLKECHEPQLRLSREIGHRPAEAEALMFCGQIHGIYLGDYEGGVALLEEGKQIITGRPVELYYLLRIAQIQALQGHFNRALTTLEEAYEREPAHAVGHAGRDLVAALIYNAIGDETHLRMALELASKNREVKVDTPQLSRQYQMVAACEEAAAHLGLSVSVGEDEDRDIHGQQALEASQTAVNIYEAFGFVRPTECVSEEIFYRHSLALALNGRQADSATYLKRAYDEVMRKHSLIPSDTSFHHTYLENIALHQEIQATYAASSIRLHTSSS